MNQRFASCLTVSVFLFVLASAVAAQTNPDAQTGTSDKPRVFITDSHSWEVGDNSGGVGGIFGGSSGGGARPQTAEIIKTFGDRCPSVQVNNIQAKANYIVLLDHEGGKGWLAHKNKVAVFDAQSGDSIVSKSTLSLGGSVEEACRAIAQHWPTHMLARTSDPGSQPQSPTSGVADARAGTCRLNVLSTPDGADIEIDGNFVGNTPSAVEVVPGEHTVAVKKSGYKAWQRNLKATGGDVNLKAELEKEGGN